MNIPQYIITTIKVIAWLGLFYFFLVYLEEVIGYKAANAFLGGLWWGGIAGYFLHAFQKEKEKNERLERILNRNKDNK